MKLRLRSFDFIQFSLFLLIFSFFGVFGLNFLPRTSATVSDQPSKDTDRHFVTIYDQGQKTTFRTTAPTVGELLNRAEIIIHDSDIVEPDAAAIIDANNFYINIYRARPVMISDGHIKQVIETASHDITNIAAAAGLNLYDGDRVTQTKNPLFTTSGVTAAYEISRSGGQIITSSVEIPATEQSETDMNLPAGQTKILEPGENGHKTIKYQITTKDGKEIARKILSEEVTTPAKPRRIAVGGKHTPAPVAASAEACATYARAAGVSEADLPAALDLINRESRCRTTARNAYSGAYGIPQALPGTKMASAGADWETNPVTQIRWMAGYVKNRYGGWQQALDFWHCIGNCRGINKRSFWY